MKLRYLLPRLFAAAIFGAAAIWSARVGLADHYARQATIDGFEKAIAATPGQGIYYARLALLLSEEDPKRATRELGRAIIVDPTDARSWIQLGLWSEERQDYPAAEKYLLRAAEADRKYLPRWTLANYYFRRADWPAFWRWANASAEMLYADPAPLFRLCEAAAGDTDIEKLLTFRSPALRSSYLQYLLTNEDADKISSSALELARVEAVPDAPLLLSACDRLLFMKRDGAALEIWNRLAERKRIPFHALGIDHGKPITNTRFEISPTSKGFDWRLEKAEGVTAAREEQSSGLRLTFSGSEPEHVVTLSQLIPVAESSHYGVNVSYQTTGIPPDSGLAWRVTQAGSGEDLGGSRSLHAPAGTDERFTVNVPPGCRLLRLALVYDRRPGTTRIKGSIVLHEVTAERSASSNMSQVSRSRVTK